MKTGKLYVKFFLTFVAILFVSEILIFSFFHFIINRNMDERIANINRYTLTSLIEDRFMRAPGVPVEDNPELRRLFWELGRVYNARLWISQNGRILCSSFDVPFRPHGRVYGMRYVIREQRRGPPPQVKLLFSTPINLPDGSIGILHMSMKQPHRGPHDITFAVGLSVIGALIAVMLFPLYRFIARPLSELKAAAIGIAGGNLSTRVNVESSDEIEDLANAFNKMADNVECMVKSTRELTANISHELRSPLTRILVAEELLEEKLDQAENLKPYLDSIREETSEIDRMIGDILRLSKLDMNSASAQRDYFDIGEMLKEQTLRWNTSAEHSGLSFEIDIPGTPVIVHAIKDDVGRAVDSLIANSIKFSDRKAPVSVGLKANDVGVTISVGNTCDPLSDEELGRIFEPFYRARGSTQQGTGLGLTIARKIAENNGGSLVASSFASGIEMLFSLPVAPKT